MPRFNYTANAWEGSNYDSSLDVKDIAKLVRKDLKKKFPGCTFSVTISRFSGGCSMAVSLMKADFTVTTDGRGGSLNPYSFNNDYDYNDGVSNGVNLTKAGWDLFDYVKNLVNSYNYDDSDSMIDYFNTNFYFDLNLGKWDKPFEEVS